MTIEQKIEDIKTKIAKLDDTWEKTKEELQTQFNQAYGFYMGNKNAYTEVLALLAPDEVPPVDEKENNETTPEFVQEPLFDVDK